MLNVFSDFLLRYNIQHNFRLENSTHPENFHRIEYLAGVRNKALDPYYEFAKKSKRQQADEEKRDGGFDKIIFINDIVFCRNDILELILQSNNNQADITCPLDIDYYDEEDSHGKKVPVKKFRDMWVARDIKGNAFSKDIKKLTGDEISNKRALRGLPFQAQCCWNGVVVLNPKPFESPFDLRFRRSTPETPECAGSECSLLCNDYWKLGFDRVVVVPGVQVTYNLREFKYLEKEYKNKLPKSIDKKIDFQEGPNQVYCRPLIHNNTQNPDGPSTWEEYIVEYEY